MRHRRTISTTHRHMLEVIWAHLQRYGRPPSYRELEVEMSWSSTCVVSHHLRQLEEEGYLKREAGKSRSLLLTEPARALLRIPEPSISIPFAGNIVAGHPVDCGEDAGDLSEAVEVSPSFLSRHRGPLYALRVRGDSMVDAMVTDGDIVILEQTSDAHNGEMVAAWLNLKQENTLKRYYREGAKVRLVPANPAYEPMTLPAADVTIQGCVRLIIREP